MNVLAAAFGTEPDADAAFRELRDDLGLPDGALKRAILGSPDRYTGDRFLVAGEVPVSAAVRASEIIHSHRGQIVARAGIRGP